MKVRLSAAERREQIVEGALARFAAHGYHGTSTEDIAADVELSQAYVFALFGTKRGLFLACCEACNDRIRGVFAEACAGDTPEQRLKSMGSAYNEVLADSALLGFQLQMYAACADDEIRARARDLYRVLLGEVRERSGASEEELLRFFGVGMLLNVATTLDLDEVLAAFGK